MAQQGLAKANRWFDCAKQRLAPLLQGCVVVHSDLLMGVATRAGVPAQHGLQTPKCAGWSLMVFFLAGVEDLSLCCTAS